MLHLAVRKQTDPAVVRPLIEGDVDVDARTSYRCETALRNAAMANLLLDAGAEPALKARFSRLDTAADIARETNR